MYRGRRQATSTNIPIRTSPQIWSCLSCNQLRLLRQAEVRTKHCLRFPTFASSLTAKRVRRLSHQGPSTVNPVTSALCGSITIVFGWATIASDFSTTSSLYSTCYMWSAFVHRSPDPSYNCFTLKMKSAMTKSRPRRRPRGPWVSYSAYRTTPTNSLCTPYRMP